MTLAAAVSVHGSSNRIRHVVTVVLMCTHLSYTGPLADEYPKQHVDPLIHFAWLMIVTNKPARYVRRNSRPNR